jgi:hypothetical protein
MSNTVPKNNRPARRFRADKYRLSELRYFSVISSGGNGGDLTGTGMK